MKKYQKFLSENFQFLVVKFSLYLNRRVFVMHKISAAFKKINILQMRQTMYSSE